jgi:uncharacterized membrane protein
MDIFIEKIVKRKKDAVDYLIVAGLVFAAVAISFVAFAFVPQASLLIAIGACYGAWYVAGMRNIEFEYCLTNGDLDIDRIVSMRKRKRIFSGNAKDFEMVAPVKSIHYSSEIKNTKKVIDASGGKGAEGVWFISTRIGNDAGVILFQPAPNMIDGLWHSIPRKVFKV